MKVSIITVCYNSVSTIEQTINSVISQDYEDIEYIIIDGGSTDGTLDVIDKYRDKIKMVVSEPDGGTYDAMNKGIKLASGDVIGMINSDDWYGEGTVRTAVAALLAHPECGVAHGREIDIFPHGEIGVRRLKTPLTEDYIVDFSHPSFFVRKSVYNEVGLYDCKYPTDADGDLVYRMFFAGVKFCYDDGIFVYFRVGGASSAISAHWERLTVHRKYARKLPEDKRVKAIAAINKKYDLSRLLRAMLFLDNRIHWQKPGLHSDINIFIFGFSVLGQLLADWLINNNRKSNITCFVDNSLCKQHDNYRGIEIKSPDTIKSCTGNVFCVIASSMYYTEIARQLREYGLQENKDFCGYFDFKALISGTDISRLKSCICAAKPH